MAQRARQARVSERRAVVGHDSLDAHVHACEPVDGILQEGAGGLAALVREDLHERSRDASSVAT